MPCSTVPIYEVLCCAERGRMDFSEAAASPSVASRCRTGGSSPACFSLWLPLNPKPCKKPEEGLLLGFP